MLNPIRLCNDLFDDEHLSDLNLRGFTENHLIRLANNNPGAIYSTLITDTTTKYTAFFGRMTNQVTKEAISQGLTITTNNARTTVQAKISQLQGLVKFKFGADSSIYQEFYPYGMDDYLESRIDDLATKLTRFATATATHLTADFPAEVIAYNTYHTAFTNARSAQVTAFVEIDVIATGRHEDRKGLTMQLTKNFLIVASNNVDNPDVFDDYFEPRFLPLTENVAATVLEGNITMGQMVNPDTTGIVFSLDTIFLFENPSPTTLRLFFTSAPGNSNTGATFDLPPNSSQKVEANEIGFSPTSQVLAVQNIGPGNGSYKITVFE